MKRGTFDQGLNDNVNITIRMLLMDSFHLNVNELAGKLV